MDGDALRPKARRQSPLSYLKIGIALVISILGLLLPWRLRILFSELLGWIAQMIPPALYRMDSPEPAQGPGPSFTERAGGPKGHPDGEQAL